MEFLSRQLGRWPIALACVVVLGSAVLLPGVGTFGLWEPQERMLADKIAPRPELAKKQADMMPPAKLPPPKDGCWRVTPPDAPTRTLTTKAMEFGRDTFGPTDWGLRLPLALLGLLTVIAAAGIAMRTSGARAGVVTGLVLLSMPLLVLQSRQLTSEIGTAAGATLIIYSLVALARPARRWWADIPISLAALVAGSVLAFLAGGALLGLLVPVAAFAVAGKLGVPFAIDVGRAARNGALGVAKRVAPRFAIGREPSRYTTDDNWPALVATLFTIAIAGVLAYQLYSLVEPQPGATPPQRALFGKAIVATGCWSSALGAIWRPDDDLRYSFDSSFEQIAYGTFPWGILGIVAMGALIASQDRRQRTIGAITLAWAGGAWLATEVFQRKVGFTIYAGFPAIAIAIGVWLDAAFAARTKERWRLPAGAILLGLFVLLAIVDLGKDMQSFTERISSLLVGSDQVAYPKTSRLLFIPTRAWILIVGGIVGVGFMLAMLDVRHAIGVHLRRAGVGLALAGTALTAAFWAFGWQPTLATHLSSKAMFDTYLSLRKPGDQLVIMGEMGDAPHDYAPDAKHEQLTSREQIVQAIARPNRVFAIAPQTELCQLHREIGGKPYFVLDDRNTRSLLLSNRVDGTTDKNPLRTAILHEEPKQIPSRPKERIVFDGRIELLGWSIPKQVSRGDKFQVKMFYKVLQPVPGNWRVLFHFDGPNGLRFNGDHEPIKGRCQTSTWQPGDFVIDTHTVTAGGAGFMTAPHDVWTGFFTGANPNWKNMTISQAPADMRDQADRVKITTIVLD